MLLGGVCSSQEKWLLVSEDDPAQGSLQLLKSVSPQIHPLQTLFRQLQCLLPTSPPTKAQGEWLQMKILHISPLKKWLFLQLAQPLFARQNSRHLSQLDTMQVPVPASGAQNWGA